GGRGGSGWKDVIKERVEDWTNAVGKTDLLCILQHNGMGILLIVLHQRYQLQQAQLQALQVQQQQAQVNQHQQQLHHQQAQQMKHALQQQQQHQQHQHQAQIPTMNNIAALTPSTSISQVATRAASSPIRNVWASNL